MSSAGLRGRLLDGPLVVAAEATSASPGAVELLAGMSFDAVVIDARHAPVSAYSDELERLIRAADSRGATTLVRVVDNTPGTINRAMNDGAGGVVVRADDAAAAERAARSLRYPPSGFRGAAPVVRAAHFGLTPWDEYREATNADRPVVVSIETAEAFGALDEIAAVPGVDAVLLDAFALAVALGRPIDPAAGPDAEAVQHLVGAGRVVGVALAEPANAPAWRAAGCGLIVVGTDVRAYAEATVALRTSLDAVPTRIAGGAGR